MNREQGAGSKEQSEVFSLLLALYSLLFINYSVSVIFKSTDNAIL